MPVADPTMDWIEFKVLETMFRVMALSAAAGSVMSKLKHRPGWDMEGLVEPRSPSQDQPSWTNARTVGLPEEVGPRLERSRWLSVPCSKS